MSGRNCECELRPCLRSVSSMHARSTQLTLSLLPLNGFGSHSHMADLLYSYGSGTTSPASVTMLTLLPYLPYLPYSCGSGTTSPRQGTEGLKRCTGSRWHSAADLSVARGVPERAFCRLLSFVLPAHNHSADVVLRTVVFVAYERLDSSAAVGTTTVKRLNTESFPRTSRYSISSR